jgi:plasmid maintenance system antidote protein VapI
MQIRRFYGRNNPRRLSSPPRQRRSWHLRPTLQAILTECAPATPKMALRLGKLCGNGLELWLALQTRYDLERLSEAKRAEIEAIPTLIVE